VHLIAQQIKLQTAGLPSGSEFPIGTTTNTFEYVDAAGGVQTCSFSITVNEYQTQANVITCNSLVHISLDENCSATVGADQILEGNDYGCLMVTNPSGNPCWGYILVEDKIAPVITCYDVDVACDEALPTEPAPATSTPGSVATTTAGGNGGAVGGMVYFDLTNTSGSDLEITAFDMNITANTLVNVYTINGTSVGNTGNAGLWTLAAQFDATEGDVSGAFPGNGTLTPALGSLTIGNGVTGVALEAIDAAHNYTNGNGGNQSFSDAFLQIDLGSGSNTPFGFAFTPRVFNGAVSYLRALDQVSPFDALLVLGLQLMQVEILLLVFLLTEEKFKLWMM